MWSCMPTSGGTRGTHRQHPPLGLGLDATVPEDRQRGEHHGEVAHHGDETSNA